MNRFADFTDYELNTLAIALFDMLPSDGDEPIYSEEMADTAARLYAEVHAAEKVQP